jgi:hypothetical protein
MIVDGTKPCLFKIVTTWLNFSYKSYLNPVKEIALPYYLIFKKWSNELSDLTLDPELSFGVVSAIKES